MREGGGLPFACLRDDDDAPSHPAARCFAAVDSDSEQEERSVREVRVIFLYSSIWLGQLTQAPRLPRVVVVDSVSCLALRDSSVKIAQRLVVSRVY